MTKTPKDQLSGLIKRRTLVKNRISAAAKGIKRGGSLKDEDWYMRAQKRFAISASGQAAPQPQQEPLDG